MAHYRFKCGVFVKADTFEEAQAKLIETIRNEKVNPNNWYECACLGFQHRIGCPEAAKESIAY